MVEMDELAYRDEQWRRLLERGGPDDVSPALVRELGVYGGAQGIWVDLERTAALVGGKVGVTVSVLHTGQHYADDLAADRLLYHYPDTSRPPGRDKGEIDATKNAARLELPLFVILRGSKDSLRSVRRGTIVGWDDELSLFRINLGSPIAAPAAHLKRALSTRARSTPSAVGGDYKRPDENVAARPRDPFTIDPDKIDRGLKGHAKTQNALYDWLAAQEITGLSPTGVANFDLAWRVGGTMYVAEVKSLTATNEAMQLRLGLGQVLDYAEMLRRAGEQSVQPVLVTEHEPSDSRWRRVCELAGVMLAWPPAFAHALAT
jgi:hypothetical protein